MAYINVAEWSTDQVTDWLRGLDNSMYHYVNSFTNNEVDGQQLLHIRPYELEQLGIYSIGHQEIVLEAVEQLRNFHYHLDKENLQFLALQVATTSQCLYNQLCQLDGAISRIDTQILSDAAKTISTIKPLLGWLDRSPFYKINRFVELRNKMMRFAIELATMAQRDRFVEDPVEKIKTTTFRVSKLANYIIQDVSDVMILQPAALNLVTIKKKGSELGFNIVPTYNGLHIVTDIKLNSPAHISGKIEDGDEIIQIEYQTVVGWHYKKVLLQLQDSPSDVIITLKKRPKHSKIYGQIYMKPYRLPSKKKTIPSRWGAADEVHTSPPALARPQLIAANSINTNHNNHQTNNLSPVDQPSGVVSAVRVDSPDKQQRQSLDWDEGSDIATPTESKPTDFLLESRAIVQRRHTICADRGYCGYKSQMLSWHKFRHGTAIAESPSLRDKSVSFGFGLDTTPRPTTHTGMPNHTRSHDIKGSLPAIRGGDQSSGSGSEVDENSETTSIETRCAKPGVSKVVRFETSKEMESQFKDNEYTCKVDQTVLEVFEPIPYADDEDVALTSNVRSESGSVCAEESAQAVNEVLVRREIARWEQKVAASAYVPETKKVASVAKGVNASDLPPAIEPRNEFLLKTPPAPPPRPRKLTQTPPSALSLPLNILPVVQQQLAQHFVNAEAVAKKSVDSHTDDNTPKVANVIALKHTVAAAPPPPQPIYNHQQQQQINDNVLQPDPNDEFTNKPYNSSVRPSPAIRAFIETPRDSTEELELLTPGKTKNLTLKKKNIILAKRRKITLKTLEVSEIQGHLYRRVKDSAGVSSWAKLYVVLTDTTLYGFRNKYSTRANCLIFLNGFTVSLATEVHSMPWAFKVYHPSKTFYFCAETEPALKQWLDYITQATIKGASLSNMSLDPAPVVNIKDLYSEAEDSDNETDPPRFMANHSPASTSKKCFGGSSSSNLNTLGADESQTAAAPTKGNHPLGFNSLKKKFSNITSSSRAAKEKKAACNSDVPVPTAQYRSYRKVHGTGGLQLGTNSMTGAQQQQDLVPAMQSSMEALPPRVELTRKASITSLPQTQHSTATPPPPISFPPAPTSPPPPLATCEQLTPQQTPSPEDVSHNHTTPRIPVGKPKRLLRTSPHNYIHASNPNLVEFDFSTSKNLDYSFPRVNPANSWEPPHSVQPLITLKDLMLQKQVEDSTDMYTNRVNLGVEKKHGEAKLKNGLPPPTRDLEPEHQPMAANHHPDETSAPLALSPAAPASTSTKFSKIQNRSLPKTPDYAQSFKPDDTDIIMTRSREGQKLRDFGYEFISGDDPANVEASKALVARFAAAAAVTAAAGSSGNSQLPVATKRKGGGGGRSWIGSSEQSAPNSTSSSRSGSFMRSKAKGADADVQSPGRPEKPTKPVFMPLSAGNSSSSRRMSPETHVYNPHAISNNASTSNSTSGYGTQGWPHGSSDSDARKASTSTLNSTSSTSSIFPKFSFISSKPAKEKKILGSPLLHRTLFGQRHGSAEAAARADTAAHVFGGQDHEIFLPVDKRPRQPLNNVIDIDQAPDQPPPPTPSAALRAAAEAALQSYPGAGTSHLPDYSHLEYPPVFEAATYSLRDPPPGMVRRRKEQTRPK